jgi:uroporphyrinogen decarboxylase
MSGARHSLLLRALRREPVERAPVWLMRQAGRYLPEYRATRARAGSFVRLMKTPELAVEVTLQPLRRYALDAAILFSDILTIPDAMGLGLDVVEGSGPRFARPLRSAADIEALRVPTPEEDLGYVLETVRLLAAELAGRTPLIGFAGAPWTLATYAVEGGPSEDFARIKTLLLTDPVSAHALLGKLADAVAAYLAAQARAGADALMLFDTWAGALAPAAYREFALAYVARVASALRADPALAGVPLILYARGSGAHLRAIADAGVDAIGLDWTVDPAAARAAVGGRVALQGNLDPAVLRAPTAAVAPAVRAHLGQWAGTPGHVFNLGHGVSQHVTPEAVAALVEAAHAGPARSD